VGTKNFFPLFCREVCCLFWTIAQTPRGINVFQKPPYCPTICPPEQLYSLQVQAAPLLFFFFALFVALFDLSFEYQHFFIFDSDEFFPPSNFSPALPTIPFRYFSFLYDSFGPFPPHCTISLFRLCLVPFILDVLTPLRNISFFRFILVRLPLPLVQSLFWFIPAFFFLQNPDFSALISSCSF